MKTKTKPIAKVMARGVKGAPTPPAYGPHWTASKRGLLVFYDDHVRMGNWRIELNDVENTTVWKAKTQLGLTSSIVEFRTSETNYQFGLNPWVNPERLLKIPYNVQHIRMRWTAYSILLRLGLLIALGWLVFDIFL